MNNWTRQEIQDVIVDTIHDALFPVLENMSGKIANIERTMVTKGDLLKMATKQDLRMAIKKDRIGLATKQDLTKFATKKDIADMATKQDLANLENKMEIILIRLEGKLDLVSDRQQQDSTRIKRLEDIVMPAT